jgi:hypothetical protein
MFQRELLIVGTMAAAIFLLVAGAGWVAVRELHETSRMLVVDTLPGLVDAGLAGERMNDNRRTMREMLASHPAAERAQMIEQVKTNSTEALWHDYATSIFEPTDQQNYQTMMLVRSNYLQGCEHFLDLVAAGKMDEATTLFNGELSHNFKSYNESAQTLFNYNVQQGIDRGKTILNSAIYAPWIIAGSCVLAFGFGLALGARFVLSGGYDRSKRRR